MKKSSKTRRSKILLINVNIRKIYYLSLRNLETQVKSHFIHLYKIIQDLIMQRIINQLIMKNKDKI